MFEVRPVMVVVVVLFFEVGETFVSTLIRERLEILLADNSHEPGDVVPVERAVECLVAVPEKRTAYLCY